MDDLNRKVDDRLRVLVVETTVSGYGGIAAVIANYYIYQDKTAIRMDLLTNTPIKEDLRQAVRENRGRHYLLSYRNSNQFKYIRELKRIVAKNRYDIVHVHGNSATMAVDLLGAKMGGCAVRIAHAHNVKSGHAFFNRLLMPLFRRLVTDPCACSQEAGAFLFGERPCHVVDNGICLDRYLFSKTVRDRVRKELGLEGKYVIGHVANFTGQKNHAFLLKIFRAVIDLREDAVLLSVGSGVLFDHIRAQAEELGLGGSVMFYGASDKVHELLQGMDCFTLPSLFEGLPVSMLEAQAAGLPCVVSDVIPRVAQVNDNVQFLPLDDAPEDWARALLDAQIMEEERAGSIDAVRKNIQDAGYDISRNCVEMLEYYRSILGKDHLTPQ